MNADVSIEPAPATETRPDDSAWSVQFRVLLIVFVFAAHIGLIFVFNDRKPVAPRPPVSSLALSLTTNPGDLQALNDPTLFALPHQKSFAGQTWMRTPVTTFEPFRWTEPPRLLALPVDELGAVFSRFKKANTPAPFEFDAKPSPVLAMPVLPDFVPNISVHSTLRIGGNLVGRRLLNPPELPSQPAVDLLLTNSVVRVLVSADGFVMSPPVLVIPSGSGSEKADRLALELARTARFEPRRDGAPGPMLGLMVFQWRTVRQVE